MTTTDALDGPTSASVAAPTVLPRRDDLPPEPSALRTLSGVTRSDVFNLGGALISALATALLLFGRIAPASGPLGFVVVSYLLFVGAYAVLVWLDEELTAVIDKVMTVLMASVALLAGLALFSVVAFILYKGRSALGRTNLYLQDMSEAGPLEPLSMGGIKHALVGTLIMITLALVFTVPLGLACAIYLNEASNRTSRLVRTVVDAMTALPSILAGLFIFATWILILGFERSGLAASLSVSIMMLPIIIRSADVVLRLVPGNLREAAAALGASQWRSVVHVVLPTARSGLATAVILGVARGIGETAPVLLTAGITSTLNVNPLKSPMISLPLATFEFVRSPQQTLQARGFATAAVLMVLVLVLFILARIAGGRPAGTVTRRQAGRLASRSARDVARFDAQYAEAR